MTALGCLLAGLIDYAGLYPPADLDMHTAARNYLEYSRSAHANALCRFAIGLDSVPYLWDAAGGYLGAIRLSVIAQPDADWDELRRLLDKGYAIEAVEIKPGDLGAGESKRAAAIENTAKRIPDSLTAYFEVPVSEPRADVLDAVETAGARIKLRLGGITAQAFPSTQAVAHMLDGISRRRMVFKATAGLHHPVRARYPLTGQPGSPTAAMHGFMNLACAAAVLHFGGDVADAFEVLEELEPRAWRVTPQAILWREHGWSGDELSEVRQKFFAGIGSCSLIEPMGELEALGWL